MSYFLTRCLQGVTYPVLCYEHFSSSSFLLQVTFMGIKWDHKEPRKKKKKKWDHKEGYFPVVLFLGYVLHVS